MRGMKIVNIMYNLSGPIRCEQSPSSSSSSNPHRNHTLAPPCSSLADPYNLVILVGLPHWRSIWSVSHNRINHETSESHPQSHKEARSPLLSCVSGRSFSNNASVLTAEPPELQCEAFLQRVKGNAGARSLRVVAAQLWARRVEMSTAETSSQAPSLDGRSRIHLRRNQIRCMV